MALGPGLALPSLPLGHWDPQLIFPPWAVHKLQDPCLVVPSYPPGCLLAPGELPLGGISHQSVTLLDYY